LAGRLLTREVPTPSPTPTATTSSAAVFYDAMLKRVELQVRVSEAYDAKTASWFALSTLVVSISAGALAAEHDILRHRSIVLAAVGTLFWLFAVLASFLSYQQSDLDTGPTEEDYARLASNAAYSTSEMQYLIAELIATWSIPTNKRLLERKALFFTCAVGLSMAQFICFALAVYLTLAG
jgi:hypothetical protein